MKRECILQIIVSSSIAATARILRIISALVRLEMHSVFFQNVFFQKKRFFSEKKQAEKKRVFFQKYIVFHINLML